MSLSLSDFFIIASVIQGFSIGMAILGAPFFRGKTNKYLASFMLCLSAMTFLGWQDLNLFWPDYLWSLMWEFLIPVFLFQYFIRVLDHPFLRAPWLPYLYAPFVVVFLVDVAFDLDFSFGIYKLPFPASHPTYRYYDTLLDTLAMWWNIFLFAWMFRIAWRDHQAPPERRRWLVRFGAAMLLVVTSWFLADLMESSTSIGDPYTAIWITMSLLFWWIAYAGVYQLRILEERAEIHDLLNRRNIPEPTGPAPVTVENGYADRLNSLMNEDHLYRNPDLGRQLLADHLGISEGYVSQVIREGLGTGFVEYVNGYRITAARAMLTDTAFDPYSLEAIGREAGFKSRSAFYEAFKKATGATPGAYRKQAKTS